VSIAALKICCNARAKHSRLDSELRETQAAKKLSIWPESYRERGKKHGA
jgi:hypothetical protein